MGNLFDLAVMVLLLGTIFVCFKLGFVRLLTPFRKIAAFVLAWSLKGTALVKTTVGKVFHTENFKIFLNERVDALWGEKIKTAASADGVSIADRFDGIFGFWGKLFSGFKDFCISLYDKEYSPAVSEGAMPSEQAELFVKKVTSHIADAAAGFFSAFVGFIVLYVVFSVGFWFAAKIFNTVFDSGLLGVVNHTLGLAVGVCYGFLLAWLLSIVFVFMLPLITTVDITTVTGGFFNITEWFYTRFFLSEILGMTI